MKDTLLNKRIEKLRSLGTIKTISICKLHNPEDTLLMFEDDLGNNMSLSLNNDIDQLTLTFILGKHSMLLGNMWYHNLNVEEVLNHLRERCASIEKLHF